LFDGIRLIRAIRILDKHTNKKTAQTTPTVRNTATAKPMVVPGWLLLSPLFEVDCWIDYGTSISEKIKHNNCAHYRFIMDNSFIPQAIDIVSKAIEADNAGDYEKALSLYRDALGRFTMGLKYEKNEARKKLVIDRVEGYMKRAEELRDYIAKQNELDKNGGGGSTTKKGGDKEDDVDAEKKKLRGALAGAIVSEKPNIKWEDVAGLENAKESLKEVRKKKERILVICFS
jgi:SpoVK/Ycf46/Vps4 family AAA+-type ATPase